VEVDNTFFEKHKKTVILEALEKHHSSYNPNLCLKEIQQNINSDIFGNKLDKQTSTE
jgi:hypothetical protein